MARTGVLVAAVVSGLVAFFLSVSADAQETEKGEKGIAKAVSISTMRKERPRRWAILIGVNKYEDEMGIGSLKYCSEDMKLLDQVITGPAGGFHPDNVLLMIDSSTEPNHRPTYENLVTMIPRWLRDAEPEDDLMIAFSGHGMTENGEAYLLPSSAKRGNLRLTGIPLAQIKEWMDACKAERKILILDCCHAGAGKAPASMSPEFQEALEKAQGFVKLASCAPNQKSNEDAELAGGHGVFTWFLANGMSGKADANGDGRVDVDEAYNYACAQTRLWARKKGIEQDPMKSGSVIGSITLGYAVQSSDTGKKESVPAPTTGGESGQAKGDDAVPSDLILPEVPKDDLWGVLRIAKEDVPEGYTIKYGTPAWRNRYDIVQKETWYVLEGTDLLEGLGPDRALYPGGMQPDSPGFLWRDWQRNVLRYYAACILTNSGRLVAPFFAVELGDPDIFQQYHSEPAFGDISFHVGRYVAAFCSPGYIRSSFTGGLTPADVRILSSIAARIKTRCVEASAAGTAARTTVVPSVWKKMGVLRSELPKDWRLASDGEMPLLAPPYFVWTGDTAFVVENPGVLRLELSKYGDARDARDKIIGIMGEASSIHRMYLVSQDKSVCMYTAAEFRNDPDAETFHNTLVIDGFPSQYSFRSGKLVVSARVTAPNGQPDEAAMPAIKEMCESVRRRSAINQ